MIVNPIKDGIVLDHIEAGKAFEIYELLNLNELDCQVALITNALSTKMGKKDIIKIDAIVNLNFAIIGYISPTVTVNIIDEGKLKKLGKLELPETIEGIIKCKNPRCITATEQELPHSFKLTDKENRVYRCIYCESKAE